MPEDSGSRAWPEPWWRPWLTHRLMVPKWIIAAVLLSAVAWLAPPLWRILLPVGFLAWFPLEYVLHRFVFHFFVEHDLMGSVSAKHWRHHLDPQTPDDLFVDPYRMTLYGVLVFGLYWGVTLSWMQAVALMAGTYAALVYYEYMHLLAHAPNAKPRLPWTRAMKRWHLLHHFKHEDHWYGVTNTAFDRLAGTATDPDEVETSGTVRTLGMRPEHEEWVDRPD